MSYTNEDAQFDDEQLHGPRCPRHGRKLCRCCIECGAAEHHAHATHCREDENPTGEDEDATRQ